MTVAAEAMAPTPGWLRGRTFDMTFVVGIAALALISGVAVVIEPDLFLPILIADLWFLGYHHVIATYTRLCFDAESFRSHRFLLLWLPLIVVAVTFAVAFGVGLWTVATVYLYWQWFHYSRQSWGVSQIYRRKSDGLVTEGENFSKIAFYLLPLWGILYRSHQAPESFLGLELKVIPVPEIAVNIAAAAALLTLGWWTAGRLVAWWHGRLPVAHTLYMVTHFAIFFTAYILIEDINYGWLVINIWHNAQYIAIVWMFNNNRFKAGIDPKAKFLSKISQDNKMWLYLLICLGLSMVVYVALNSILVALVAPVLVYQAINFHHYIVDGVIWKIRRKPLQQTLGISS